MPRCHCLLAVVLGALVLASCDRTSHATSKGPAVGGDTSGSIFTENDAKAVRSALETRLQLDEFTAIQSGPTPYSSTCRAGEQAPLRQFTDEDIRVAFVKPRVISIQSMGGGSANNKLAMASAEITRIATIQRSAKKWRGAMGVSLDTLSFILHTSDTTGRWTVCGMPGHDNGQSSDGKPKPYSAWLPVNARDADEVLQVMWGGNSTGSKILELATSILKPSAHPVIAGNPEPPLPIYFRRICRGEGCAFGEWLTCDTLRVFAEARIGAPTAFILNPGDRFTAVTGDVRVTQAGQVVFSREVEVDEGGTNLVFTPADTLYPLFFKGEGAGSWYFRGKRGDGSFFFGTADQDAEKPEGVGYSLIRPIRSEWWVKARAKDGREGWFVPRDSLYENAPHQEPMRRVCPELVPD